MAEVKHTPTPWRRETNPFNHKEIVILGSDNFPVAIDSGRGDVALSEVNFDLIVTAVTAHNPLMHAFALFSSAIRSGEPWTDQCQAAFDAVKAASGEQS